MKRWLAKIFITTYLTALAVGIACHTMNFGLSSHTAMYYLVWDMFCGWSAHEIRFHIIGEGESGAYYSLSPAPWNTFAPYGDLERGQYDAFGHSQARIAMNTLRHTDHEPILRILVIEESWPKKFNLPDSLWKLRFDEEKDAYSYFSTKLIFNGEGELLRTYPEYLAKLQSRAIEDNPRLRDDARRGKPFFAVDPTMRNSSWMSNETPSMDVNSSSQPFDSISRESDGSSVAGGDIPPSAN